MNKNKIALSSLLVILLGAAFYFRDYLNLIELKYLIQEAGVLAPILFMLIYILLTLLLFPVSLLTLAAGALFGPWLGTLYSLTGATLGATASFLLARYLFRETVSNRAGNILKKLIHGVNEEGWHFVAFIRLVPLFPFNIINYLFGLTTIKLSHYVITSYLFMFPGTIAYAYIGFVGSNVAMGETQGLIKNSLLALALLAIILFIPKLILKYRKKNKQSFQNDDPK
jgi:uncharacterized membrane protein YdjX (TVP38/TMEM64 family)